jgi:trehalose synthase
LDEAFTLEHYSSIAHLADAVRELEAEARALVPHLRGRTLWLVNSTAQGGGVAEMLPKVVTLLEELGVQTRWVVMGTDRPEFFAFTKRLHNLIHGVGEPDLTEADRQLYESVNEENARELAAHLGPDDIVVIHDPQPLGMGRILKQQRDAPLIWRCHIGLDEHLPATRAAWEFLRPYAEACDHAVFSAPEYIPDYLAGRSTIIHPALDPESHKNRMLSAHKLVGILVNAGITLERHPVLTPAFHNLAQRLRPDGRFTAASEWEEIGVLYRPIVTQVSRWDRLKGFSNVLRGFIRLKERLAESAVRRDERHRRRLEIVRLVLAGPDPASIRDDPEGRDVLEELSGLYTQLDPRQQQDIALLALPMDSRKENALMVNALQLCSTIVVQNSLREGFGLTATEAMWKRVPVIGTMACGLRQQIRSGVDGLLLHDPANPDELADALDALLADPVRRDLLARSAQRRVHDEFLIFTQLRRWLRLLSEAVRIPARRGGVDPPT